MNELALFAGAGGGILGGKLLGWRTVCAVELDAYARDVLVARQNDGCLDPFPIWDDVCTFDGRPWRGLVDVVSGGFPCQDISAAGKGVGITGARSGLWRHMARIVGEVRPRFVWVENSPLLVQRGLAFVLGDLAAMGYDARWGVVGAVHAGAPHRRERIWMLADADNRAGSPEHERQPEMRSELVGGVRETGESAMDNSDRERCHAGRTNHGADDRNVPGATDQDAGQVAGVYDARSSRAGTGSADGSQPQQTPLNGDREVRNAEVPRLERPEPAGGPRATGRASEHGQRDRCADWWATEPDVGGVADGLAADVDPHGARDCADDVARVASGVRNRKERLSCIGNGQVPAAMVLAWRMLTADR